MMGFDDAAMMGLGAINAGVQIFGQNAQRRQQTKLVRQQRAQDQRHHDYDIKNVELGQEDVNRKAGLEQQGSRESDFDRGMGRSSQRQYDYNQIEGERGRRYDALERQKNMMNLDWTDHITAQKIQDRMAKTQRTMSMISSALMQGGSGVGSAFGGSSMGG